MSTSSRPLYRVLSILRDRWDSEELSLPKDSTDELFSEIEMCIKEANSSQLIKHKDQINEILLEIYEIHIKHKGNLNKELAFLKILSKVGPYLVEKIIPWIKGYLKPAIDSGGCNLALVDTSRDLIRGLFFSINEGDDEFGNASSNESLSFTECSVQREIIDLLVRIYLEKDVEALHIIGESVEENELDTQIFCERMRYLRSNCCALLREIGPFAQSSCFHVLHDNFQSPKNRLSALTVMAKLFSSSKFNLKTVASTNLFKCLLKTLLYDFDERVLQASLLLLTTLLPHVASQISCHFYELLFICSRLSIWKALYSKSLPSLSTLSNEVMNSHISWDPTFTSRSNQDEPAIVENSTLYFNISPLITLLYGLYPRNILQFSYSPLDYLTSHIDDTDNDILLITYVKNYFGVLSDEQEIDNLIKESNRSYMKSFLLHPDLMQGIITNLSEEISNGTQWLSENLISDNTPMDFAICCFKLNPSIYLRMNPCSTHFEYEVDNMESFGSPTPFFKFNSYFDDVRTDLSISGWRILYQPTYIVHQDSKTDSTKDETPGILNDLTLSSSEISFETSLLKDHERFFSPNYQEASSDYSPKQKQVAEEDSNFSSLTLSPVTNELQASPKCFDDTISSGNHPEYKNMMNRNNNGSNLDFYSREILLMKNELEFVLYVKHLLYRENLNLKETLHQMLRKINYLELKCDSKELRNHESEISNRSVYVDELQRENIRLVDYYQERISRLIDKLKEVENSNEILLNENNNLVDSRDYQSEKLKIFTEKILPLKDREIRRLRDRLSASEAAAYVKSINTDSIESDTKKGYDIELLQYQIIESNRKIKDLENKLSKTQLELKKLLSVNENLTSAYETKLSLSKLELQQEFLSFNATKENKIKELLATIQKYENLLEEKNSRLLHLSASKPIPIPGNSSTDESLYASSFLNSSSNISDIPNAVKIIDSKGKNNNRKSENSQLHNNAISSLEPTSTNSNYFSRGRGGIQNRSKMFI